MRQPAVGIMQGRLSASGETPAQVFPWRTWEEELPVARRAGFDTIEWLFEGDDYELNPLWTMDGRRRLRACARIHGVRIDAVCAHYFIQRPVLQDVDASRAVLAGLIVRARHAGIARIVLPWIESGSLKDRVVRQEGARFIAGIAAVAEAHDVVLAIESDLPASDLLAFAHACQSPAVRICYDTGNALAEGRDAVREVREMLWRIAEVHVKDRTRDGVSRQLGEGDTPLAAVLALLAERRYAGPLVLETPPGADPEAVAIRNLTFVRRGLAAPVLSR